MTRVLFVCLILAVATAAFGAADDVLRVRGRVVAPDGKPVSDADVSVVQTYWTFTRRSVPLVSVKSDAAGRFALEFRKSQFVASGIEPWRSATVVAFSRDAKLGPAWRNDELITLGGEVTLQLVPDEPIEGRIVDSEGQPISGAEVGVSCLIANESNDLGVWLNALKSGIPLFGSQRFGEPDRFLSAEFVNQWRSKTDRDGRFRLSGVGRDRVAHICISGAGIVPAVARVVSRPMQSIKIDTTTPRGHRDSSIYYGSRFQITTERSQPIEGVVRDAKTGTPLAGVRVLGSMFAGNRSDHMYAECLVESTSDDRGIYHLRGMPNGTGNAVLAVPADGQPYFMREFDVPTAPGFQPVNFDLDLHRGALIHGRVTDAATGAPVDGAWMHYIPWPDNPNIRGTPEFGRGYLPGPQSRYRTGHDGRFTLVGLPGRGLVEVGRVTRAYPSGQGVREIADLPTRQQFLKVAGVLAPDLRAVTAVKETNIGNVDRAVDSDIQLDPGKRIVLKIVDTDGKPLSGVRADGLGPRIGSVMRVDAGPTVEVSALASNEKRLLLLYQKERNLGKAVRVSWSDDGAGPIIVKLEACATLRARLLDKHGDPVRGGTIAIDAEREDFALSLPSGATDNDGRVDYPTLLPGGTYDVMCDCKQVGSLRLLAEKLSVAPGEIIDLGEFDVTSKNGRPKPIRSNPTAPR